MRPRVLLVSVDGAQPSVVRRHGLFGSVVPDRPSSPVVVLRTPYPSSTATGHATLLTGTAPARHHIVGNRFWEHEDVKTIRARAADPVASFHPYERRTLACGSLLDTLQRAGLRTVAVHFPQTLDRVPSPDPVAAVFWLYAPAREFMVRFGVEPSRLMTRYLSHEVPLTIERTSAGLSVSLGEGTAQPLPAGGRATLQTEIGQATVSVPVEARDFNSMGCRLLLHVAAVTLASGEVARTASSVSPAGFSASYRDGRGAEYFDVPRAAAVTNTTLALVDAVDPDVVLVRYNQVDHAQEFLGWDLLCEGGAVARSAQDQVLAAYMETEGEVRRLVRELGPGIEVVVASDHGIDWVDRHVRPNALLSLLGCADQAVFQGDSTCAFLYAAPGTAEQVARVVAREIAALGPGVRVLSERDLYHLDLPVGSSRLGTMVLGCGPHQEFLYDEGPLHERVRSASHGFAPESPAMDAFARFAGRASSGISAPARLDGLRAALESVIRRTFHVDM